MGRPGTCDIDATFAELERQRLADRSRIPSRQACRDAQQILERADPQGERQQRWLTLGLLGGVALLAVGIALFEGELLGGNVAVLTVAAGLALFATSGVLLMGKLETRTRQRVALGRLLDAGCDTTTAEELTARCAREGHPLTSAADLLLADLIRRR